MTLPITLHLLAFVVVVLGGPLVTPDFHHFTPTTELIKRHTCEPENMGYGVSHYDCPEKHTLDSNGHCSAYLPDAPDSDGNCLAYCEVRLTTYFGQEQPFADSPCEAETTCTITTGQSIEVTNSYTFNVGISFGRRDLFNQVYASDTIAGRDSSSEGGSILSSLKAAFDAGASYTGSESITYTLSIQQQKSLNATTCGYWTFIPYVMESCGTLTAAAIGTIPSKADNVPYCNKDVLTDTANYCNTALYYDENGHAQGQIVFVFTDCATDELLPLSQQTPPYNDPGVSTGIPAHKKAVQAGSAGPKLLQ